MFPFLSSSLEQSGYYKLKAYIEFIKSHTEYEQWVGFQVVLFSDAEPKYFQLGTKRWNLDVVWLAPK